jgi:hypothetical protein
LAELTDVEKYFLARASEANYGLWNALLIINGILVSAFSSLAAVATRLNKELVTTIIISCSISIILILWNYLTTKWHYLKVGTRISSKNLDLSEEHRQIDIKTSLRRHRFIIWREYIVLLLLLLEIAILVFMVFTIKEGTLPSNRNGKFNELIYETVKSTCILFIY